MIKLILMNLLLIIVIPTYIVYTKYGTIEYGTTYHDITAIFTTLSIFLTASIIAANHKDKEWKSYYY